MFHLATTWLPRDAKNAMPKGIISSISMNTHHDQLVMSAMGTGTIHMTYFAIPHMGAVGQVALSSNPDPSI